MDLLVAVVTLLIGGAGGGFVMQLRRDRRLGRVDEAAIFEQVRTIARDEVAYMQEKLDAERRAHAETERRGRDAVNAERRRADEALAQERRERERVERYLEVVVEVLRAHGIAVPEWPVALRVVGDDGPQG